MPINFEWKIEQMEVYPEKNGYSNVVFNIHWRCNASDENYFATSYGTVAVIFDEKSEFVPYDDLSKNQVINWVKNSLGNDQVKKIEDGLLEKIDKMKKPTVAIKLLPWE